MKRLKSFLACALTLAVIGVAGTSALAEGETKVLEGGDGIFLSDIEWESWSMFESKSTDASPKYHPTKDIQENEMLIKIAGITYLKGLRYHPDNIPEGQEEGIADITYDISSYGCTRFYSIVGKDSVGAVAHNIRFQVIGDDKVLAETPILGPMDSYAFENVDISGVTKLTLRALSADDGITDDSCAWANTQIYKNKPSVPEAEKQEVEDGLYLSDIDWASWSMYHAKSTDATPEFQPTKDTEEKGGPIVIAGVHYPKGLRYHPDEPGADGQGIGDITYDLTKYNYTRFDAIVGKDSVGAAGDRSTKIKFQVLGDDGKVLAESPELTNAQGYAFSKVDIEGVKTLTLRCLTVDDMRDDSCAWGNVKIYKTGEGGQPSGDGSQTSSKNETSKPGTSSNNSTNKAGGLQPWVIVVIVVAVVVILAVVVFVVMKKKGAK